MSEKGFSTVSTGLELDFRNLYGAGKVTDEDIAELDARIGQAYRSVNTIRQTGRAPWHLSKDGTPEAVLFPQLPYIQAGNINNPASIARLKQFGESLRYNVDAVISFGIGGSYLGNKVLFDIQCGEFWNSMTAEERDGYPQLYFSGNNIDPQRTHELVRQIVRQGDTPRRCAPPLSRGDTPCSAGAGDGCASSAMTSLVASKGNLTTGRFRVLLVAISKSGATLDTMSNFLVVYNALRAQPQLEVSVAAVTDLAEGENETLLHRIARENGWPMFSVPDGVGGRFSVFSEVGLTTAACIGFDMDGFLAGARDMDQACLSGDPWENPALLNAVLKYVAAEKYGRHIEIFMPYGDAMKSLSEWYVQLLAESLGKRTGRDGREVCYGRTPVVAVGTTDMHAQTQLHQDGPRDKVVQFVQVKKWANDPVIPEIFSQEPQLTAMAGLRMSEALDAARESNAAALAGDGRFNATFALPELNAYHLGGLMYMLALSIAYEGELAQVDAYDQPGVEAYKRLLGPKLARLQAKR